MNDWQRLEVYLASHLEELRREAEQARLLGSENRGNRRVGRWIVIAALLMSLSAWWIL
jgi:hypothetical protein